MVWYREKLQDHVDQFAIKHGPCCAGCDHWRYHNSMVGDCTRSAPVSSEERTAMLHIDSCSLPAGAGHVMTLRDHVCGEFTDSELGLSLSDSKPEDGEA